MLSRSDEPAETAYLDQLVEEVVQIIRAAEANGIDGGTLLDRTIKKWESQSGPSLFPTLDQLVQRKRLAHTKACSGWVQWTTRPGYVRLRLNLPSDTKSRNSAMIPRLQLFQNRFEVRLHFLHSH